MFIHIGADNVIRSEDVVAIIDHQLVSSSTINEQMLFNQRKNKKVLDPSDEAVKSLVITKEYIYYSPLSVLTLKKRASMISTISKLEDYSESFDE
ncbi:extracellular matrix regulator RemB [Sediminibacillus massiliensis]|uniref:extracellular matrix regulator RemB n=1 Tax=Sediminibacillus massiliensis TaxID=1926277 RepID=UPI0009888716|nr:extracellular matrix/biofilm biosynthesis regulator RemA family protein [Sediminibacillus massiliensis]